MIEEVEIQEQEPQQQQPDPPKKKLWSKLNMDKLYTKSYEEFEQQFNTPEKIDKLYQTLSSQQLYTKSKQEFEQQFFTPTVKKKSDLDFSRSSLEAGNALSQSGGVDGGEIPTIEMYTTPNGEMVEANPIALSKKYRELVNRKTEGATIGGGSFTMGTTSTPVEDVEAQKSAKKLKEDFPDIDFEGISEEIKDVSDEALQRFGKELMQDREQNNPLYQRKLANIKWRSGLEQQLLNDVDNGNIDPDNYNRIKESIDKLPVFTGSGDFTNQRGAIQSLAKDIQLYGGENRDKILNNFAIEISKVYGSAYNNNFDKTVEGSPESKYLNNDEQLALQYLKDVAPDKAGQYDRLLIDPKTLKDNPNALKGYNHLKQTLEETGIGLQQNAVTEELNNLKRIAERDGGLTEEQLTKATDLEKKQEELTQKRNELDSKYPDRVEDKVDDALQEIMGQRIAGMNYFGGTAFKAIKNTAQGIWEGVSSPFMSDASNSLRELAIMGETLDENRIYHKTDKNQALLTDRMVIEPELQVQIDAIKNDKLMTDDQKEMKIYRLLKDNTDKFGRVPIKGGKWNINGASIAYGLSDLGTTLLPFIAIEAATGGGATAGLARKFMTTFTAAAATTFHDEYASALLSGKSESEAYKEAMGMTAISSLAMAGAATPSKIKAMVNPKTSAGKLILSMSDDAIQKVLDKGVPKSLKAIGNRLIGTGKAAAGGLKTGAEFEVAMTAANELKHQIYDTEIDREANFKHSLLAIGNFGILGAGLGQFGYKSPTEMQKGAGLMFAEKPKDYISVAEEMRKNGQLTETEFNHRVELINQFGDAYKSVPKDLSAKDKADYLYQTVIKNEATKGKSDLPPKQAAEAEKTALVADYKRGLIIEPQTDKQLEKTKASIEKKLEPKKDADGKAIEIPEKEKLALEAELEAVNDAIETGNKNPIKQYREKNKITEEMVSDDALLKDIAEQAQNISGGKENTTGDAKSLYDNTVKQAGKELVDLAISKYPKEKLLSTTPTEVKVFHGAKGGVEISEFSIEESNKNRPANQRELGVHFGTDKNTRALENTGGKPPTEYTLKPKKVLELEEVDQLFPLQVNTFATFIDALPDAIRNKLKSNKEEYRRILRTQDVDAVRKSIMDEGYDTIAYKNYAEDNGKINYIALDPSSIKKTNTEVKGKDVVVDEGVVGNDVTATNNVELVKEAVKNNAKKVEVIFNEPYNEAEHGNLPENVKATLKGNKKEVFDIVEEGSDILDLVKSKDVKSIRYISEQSLSTNKEVKNEAKDTEVSNTEKKGSDTAPTVSETPPKAEAGKGGKEPPQEPNKPVEGDGDNAGITQAANAVRRMDRQMAEFEKIPQSFEQWNNEAEAALKKGYDVEALMDRLEKNPTAATPVENAIRKIYIATLDAEIAKNPTDALLAKQKRFVQIGDAVNRIAGQQLVSLKGQGSPLSTISDFYVAKMEAIGADKLTDAQKAEVKKQYEQVQKTEKDAALRIEKLEAENAKLRAEAELRKAKSTTKKEKKDFVKERADIKKNILDKWNKAKNVGITADPSKDLLMDIAPDVAKLVKSYIQEGVVKLEEIVSKIHEDIKGYIPSITEKNINDIIAGIYDAPKETKGDLLAKLNSIKDKKSEEAVKIKARIKAGDFAPPKKTITWVNNPELKKKYPKEYKAALDALQAKEDARHEFDLAIYKDQMKNRSKAQKVSDFFAAGANTTKKVVTGIDDSAIGIQTLAAMLSRPVVGAKALVMHGADAFSQKRFDRRLTELHNAPDYDLMKKSGLDITEPKSLVAEKKEEVFGGETWDIKFKMNGKEYKVLGGMLKPFERAFTSLGNGMRVIAFRTIAEKLQQEGYTFEKNPKVFEDLAQMLNTETGRGKQNEYIQKASELVTAGIWSPKLMASRLNMLGITDALSIVPGMSKAGTKGYYRQLDPRIRKEAVKDLVKFSASVMALSYLAAWATGGTVDTDPDSQTFLDIKSGDKSYNLSGGFAQYIRLVAQSIKGGKRSNGEFKEFDANRDKSRGQNILHFMRGKVTPVAGVGIDLLTGRDFAGNPIELGTEVKKLTIPLSMQNVASGIERDGYSSLFTTTLPNFVGINVKDKRDFIKQDLNMPEWRFLEQKNLRLVDHKKETLKPLTEDGKPIEVTEEKYKQFVQKREDIVKQEVKDLMSNGAKYEDEEGYEVEIPASKVKEIEPEEIKKWLMSTTKKATEKAIEEVWGEQPKVPKKSAIKTNKDEE